MLTRYNRKSVTVITDTGEHWTVAPGLLKKAEDAGKNAPDSDAAELLQMRRK